MSPFDPSAQTVLKELRTLYPETPFLALGQTVWWDEPMKAVLRLMLDEMGLGGRMQLGVHDTDYFAKVSVRQAGQSHYELMPHNDGATKDLWSAAGEISRLFGSECFPTRHDFMRHGVPLNRNAKSQSEDRLDFIGSVTEAWGWRGLVYTGSRELIVHTMKLREMIDSVEEMLRYGFEGTQESIANDCCREEARRLSERLLTHVREYYAAHPECTLSEMYQNALPLLYEMLLGAPPSDIDVDCTAHLLRLTPETASLPRFAFVDLFLNEKTRSLAARAYNEAVAGSEIYTLDRFGLGALPFDLVLPQHGRGTLRVTLRAIHVETREPLRIPLKQPINSIHELAEILTREFGNHVTLVGKAVALISMLAREFIFVFNEEGSLYVSRTRRMNDILRAHGVPVEVHPILRVRYPTWDALAVGKATLRLPHFLAATFGQRDISSAEFAASWRSVVDTQLRVLKELEDLRSPRELLLYLDRTTANGWRERLTAYDAAKQRLCVQREEALKLQARVDALWDELARIKAEIRSTEKAKGDHFRSTTDWTPDEDAKRAAFDARIAALLESRGSTMARIAELKAQRLAFERGPETEPARREVARIDAEAGMARLEMVRNAVLTHEGLTHTQHRPSAWWLPMADTTGEWFRRIAATTEVYTEPLITGSREKA